MAYDFFPFRGLAPAAADCRHPGRREHLGPDTVAPEQRREDLESVPAVLRSWLRQGEPEPRFYLFGKWGARAAMPARGPAQYAID
ncbi:hypothetical protein [Polaromonas jejuensis]|uniref:Uncharacterized protein n=1 Tax=Polaromonas jejuensis TaxID=457502 RepID=A0ABW0Q8F9_9BURK|nr:hypothetical protein [Polaromonas jejuensis]